MSIVLCSIVFLALLYCVPLYFLLYCIVFHCISCFFVLCSFVFLALLYCAPLYFLLYCFAFLCIVLDYVFCSIVLFFFMCSVPLCCPPFGFLPLRCAIPCCVSLCICSNHYVPSCYVKYTFEPCVRNFFKRTIA